MMNDRVIYSFVSFVMFLSVVITSLISFLIIYSLLSETLNFFRIVPISEFILGTHWNPNGTIMPDGSIKKVFGVLPLLSGTLLVTTIAALIAGPIGILSGIFISYYTPKRTRDIVKPLIELLAGIPSVVYGYFAVTIISPLFYSIGNKIGINISQESALASGTVIGIMIMPVLISLIDDVLHSVPKSLYYGSLVLGATRAETIFSIIIPSALPGISSAILLAITRAIGETMIVFMATGVSANMTLDPFKPITTMTVQIATLLTGDQTFSSVETLSAYAMGFILFILTWFLNAAALSVVNKYKR